MDEVTTRLQEGQMCWPRSAPAWWQLTAARDIVATVLVVDDDPRVQRVLHATLAAQSYRVLVAGDGASALGIAVDRKPDLLVLDLDLPDFDGTEVIAGLRGWSTVPIIVLSARDDRDSKVGALDAGADDYVTKPFEMGELLARVRAVLRRRAQPTGTQDEMTIETDAFTVDLVVKKVHTDGVEVHLTPHEWAVLELLVRNPGRLVTQRQLLVHVWGPNHTTESNYLRVYLGQLRRKLERVPAQPRHLLTEPGMGYRFEP